MFSRPGKHQFLGWTSSSLLWLTMMDRTLDWWVMNLHQPERGILSIPLMDHMLLSIVENWLTIGSYYFLLAIRSSYDVRYDTLLFFLCKWYPGWWFGTFFIFHSLGIITPTDFHIFQRGRAQPPTSTSYHPCLFVFSKVCWSPIACCAFCLAPFPARTGQKRCSMLESQAQADGSHPFSSSWSYRHHHKPISGWQFGTWFLWLSIYWECHHPNWLIFFRGVETTNQLSKIALTPQLLF